MAAAAVAKAVAVAVVVVYGGLPIQWHVQFICDVRRTMWLYLMLLQNNNKLRANVCSRFSWVFCLMPLILDILKTARLSQRHTLQQPPANNHSKDNAIIFHKEQTVSINICVSECVHCVLLRQPLQLDSVR